MTIQDLKDNREHIIARINELVSPDDVKTFMRIMAMNVDDFDGDIDELIDDVYWRIFKPTKTSRLAEALGGIKEKMLERGKNWNPITSSWE